MTFYTLFYNTDNRTNFFFPSINLGIRNTFLLRTYFDQFNFFMSIIKGNHKTLILQFRIICTHVFSKKLKLHLTGS